MAFLIAINLFAAFIGFLMVSAGYDNKDLTQILLGIILVVINLGMGIDNSFSLAKDK